MPLSITHSWLFQQSISMLGDLDSLQAAVAAALLIPQAM
jgi:tRNA G18 (ribose-2'-O)-methylase SpoU